MNKLISVFIAGIVFLNFSINADAVDNNGVVRRVASEKKRIALTFDDGPHYKYTEEILNILEEFDVKATFFIIGSNADMHPELIELEIEKGHEVGNHTYDHVYLKGIDSTEIDKQISDAESVIADVCDYTPKLLRPPGGLYDEKLPAEAEQMGYTIILWSIDTRDWSHPAVDAIVSGVVNKVRSGDIILMHDFIGGAPSPTPEAVKRIIPKLLDMGYEFVTVSELLEE